jgi:hypothetical protein
MGVGPHRKSNKKDIRIINREIQETLKWPS